ncbi:MAG: 2-amino-4-hydroxy-6-hydroxymethyldihydropteridine diphosphokinase [Succinatimonas sp.]|nr:2-amino-4-hydroxy-6-hydroxymethyldihydropteridine diphosphokinase [Succinatimonas sp.]
MTTRVYLGVGSNLNRENSLRFAVAKLEPLFKNFVKSSVWSSHAIRTAEPDYLNMVVGGDVEMPLQDLFDAIMEIEKLAGKELMFNNGTNFGVKRRLDIDILVYGDTITTEPCKLPRHDIQDYPFVLCPLCELDADLIHPLLNIRIGEIWAEMEPRLPDNHGVSKFDMDWSEEAPSWNGSEE